MPTEITKAALRALPGKGKGNVLRDLTLVGFVARKLKDGRIKFECRREGRAPLFRALGHSPPLTLAEAREAARLVLARHELTERAAPPPGTAVVLSGPEQAPVEAPVIHTLDSAWEKYQLRL